MLGQKRTGTCSRMRFWLETNNIATHFKKVQIRYQTNIRRLDGSVMEKQSLTSAIYVLAE